MDAAEATWAEDDLVLISALEHWSYCPRQCALIHLEQTYDENLYTLRGTRAHRTADEAGAGTERGVRVARAVPLWSDRLGLVGRADVVEWHGAAPYPVEYKTGARRTWGHEALQLCAQALCLEEMLATAVPAGAIWYPGSREGRGGCTISARAGAARWRSTRRCGRRRRRRWRRCGRCWCRSGCSPP